MIGVVLVTGGSGALGMRVLARLRDDGWRTRALEHRRPVEGADETVRGNLSDPQSLATAVEDAEAILHLAAVTHTRKPREYEEVNVGGTRNLLAAATRSDLRRFVHVSTRAISERGGAYSQSKAKAERLVQQSGLAATIVRLPEVYGGDSKEGLDRVIASARDGRRIAIVGRGTDLVCPIHIDDAVAALVASLQPGAAAGKTYTLAGECVSLASFALACTVAFESTSRPLYVPTTAVAVLAFASRFLPLPIYPDQLARLRAPKPFPSPDARDDLGFSPRPLQQGLLATGAAT